MFSNCLCAHERVSDNKIYEAYMGPTWGRQDPGGSHAGPTNLAVKQFFAFISRKVSIWCMYIANIPHTELRKLN